MHDVQPERWPLGLIGLARLAHCHRPFLKVARRNPKKSVGRKVQSCIDGVPGQCPDIATGLSNEKRIWAYWVALYPSVKRSSRQHAPSMMRARGRRKAATGTRLASVEPTRSKAVKARRKGSRETARQSPMLPRTARKSRFLGTTALCGIKGMMPVAGSSNVLNFSITPRCVMPGRLRHVHVPN